MNKAIEKDKTSSQEQKIVSMLCRSTKRSKLVYREENRFYAVQNRSTYN